MLALFVRLFALRPLLSVAILGVPVLTLIVIGFFALWAIKILFFVVLPVGLVVWLARKLWRMNKNHSCEVAAPSKGKSSS